MIPTIGVVVCLYVFARCVEMSASEAQHALVKVVSGLVAVVSAVASVWIIRSAIEVGDSLLAAPMVLP